MQRMLVAALFVSALMFGAPSEARAQNNAQLRDIQITSLATSVDDEDREFEIIFSRMDETATAAVFFGIIGAVANSAANNAEDDERAAPYLLTAEAIDLDGIVANALNERLAARIPELLASEGASHTLLVEIGEWGLIRRASLPDTQMRAFLKLNISLLDARGRRVWGPQREHSVGQLSADMAEFTPEIMRTEIEQLAARAGHQVANRVIYR